MDRAAFEHAFHEGVHAAATYIMEKSAENYAAVAKNFLVRNPKKSLAAGALALGGAGLAAAPAISRGNKKEEAYLNSVAGKGRAFVDNAQDFLNKGVYDLGASIKGSDNKLLTTLGLKNRPLLERLAGVKASGSGSEKDYMARLLKATAPEQKILARY